MQLQRYHDQTGFRTALVIKEGRKWMNVLVISEGQLQITRRLGDPKTYKRAKSSTVFHISQTDSIQ